MNSVWGSRHNSRAGHESRKASGERIHFCFPGWPKTACGMRWKVPMDEWNLSAELKLRVNCTLCQNAMSVTRVVAQYRDQGRYNRQREKIRARKNGRLCIRCGKRARSDTVKCAACLREARERRR